MKQAALAIMEYSEYLTKREKAYTKIRDVILSCETTTHCTVAFRMIRLYGRMFPIELLDFRVLLLLHRNQINMLHGHIQDS